MCNDQTVLDAATHQHYGLLLFDLGLPGRDGHAVLGSLYVRDDPVLVLILTARDVVDERICNLDGGADNYVLKPFEMVKLLVRMRAVLRRKSGTASPMFTNGVLTLDSAAHEARMGDVEPVRLPARGFMLLQALMLWPGATLSRTELEEHIYSRGHEMANNTAEFLIHILRRKLDARVIKNVRGVEWVVPKGQ